MQNIQFMAYLPSIQSAFKGGGDGSARIQIEVPEQYKAAALQLWAYGTGKPLKITVEVIED